MQHHKEENTYQEGGTMDEDMRRTAEDGAELLDFREGKQARDFTDTMCDIERAEMRSWLDEDALERIWDFAAYMESHGHNPEQLTEVIEKVARDPLLLTVYDLMNAGDVLHMVPCVTFHDEVPFVEAINEHGGQRVVFGVVSMHGRQLSKPREWSHTMNDKTSYRTITTETIEDGEYAGYTRTETTYHGECALVAALQRVREYVDVALWCEELPPEASELLEAIDDVAHSALKGRPMTTSVIGR
jgi:hypothetical protein